MKIFLLGDSAFIEMSNNYMLCIGSKEEVDKADAIELHKMIVEAIAMSKWRAISASQGMTLH